MLVGCAKSCGSCNREASDADAADDTTDEDDDEDDDEAIETLKALTLAFGELQQTGDRDGMETVALIQESVDYMKSDAVQSLPGTIIKDCLNRHALCAFWAAIGTYNIL
jgi:hypothetical protein